jgi:hypothetical protein
MKNTLKKLLELLMIPKINDSEYYSHNIVESESTPEVEEPLIHLHDISVIPNLSVISYNGGYVISCMTGRMRYMKYATFDPACNLLCSSYSDWQFEELGNFEDPNFTDFIDGAKLFESERDACGTVMRTSEMFCIRYNLLEDYTEVLFNNHDIILYMKNRYEK